MAIDKGWDGWIEVGSSDAPAKTSEVPQITEWTLEMTGDALEKTAFGSTYDREFEPGLRGWSGTLSGYSDDGDNVQDYMLDNFTATGGPYTSTEMQIVFVTGHSAGTTKICGFNGKAVLTNVTRGATPEGLQTFSAAFQGTGKLDTYAT